MSYKNIETRRAKAREAYKLDPTSARERTSRNKKLKRAEFAAFKASLSCTICGENHPATLDFHHHTPHPDNIKIQSLLKNQKIKFAMQEIAEKCIVLCANCHRKHHYEENKKPPSSVT